MAQRGGERGHAAGRLRGVAVFRGDAAKSVIPVRLRYRIANGRVAWSLLPHRAEDVLRLAVNDMVVRIAEATHLPVYAGVPEPAAQ